MEKLNKNLKVFIFILLLNLLAINMGNVFINIFLMKISESSLHALIYNAGICIMILVAFLILAPICKGYSKKVGIFIGNIVSCILYITVIILGDKAGSYVVLLGILSGLAQGFFWLSVNTMMVDLTNVNNRNRFNSIFGIVTSVTQMIGPLVASIIVSSFRELVGYTILFVLIAIIMIISLVCTFFLTEVKSYGKFSLMKTCKRLNLREFNIFGKVVSKVYFREGVVAFLINIMIFEVVRSEDILGKLITFMTTLSILTYYMLSRKRLKIRNIYLIGTVINVISVMLLTMFFDNMFIIMIYLIIYGVSMPLTVNPVNIIGQNLTEKIDLHKDSVLELTCLREIYVGIGRISSTILLVVLYSISGDFSTLWIFGSIAIILSLSSIREIKRI